MSTFRSISLPSRPEKPRKSGITMVLDKNMGINTMKEFLESCGDYVDLVKFGWGTSNIFPPKIIREKIKILNEYNVLVCPGGTLFEVAYAQNKVDSFLSEAKELGFSCIEISDGTVDIPHDEKLKAIKKAKESGFIVISEVGKKNPITDKRYSFDERIKNAKKELEYGSYKIIIEARESGSVGVYDDEGDILSEMVERLVSELGAENIIFESPLHKQQIWFITNLGNSVNLGNIPPDSCINLETLRRGLRSDTLAEYHIDKTTVSIENGISGAIKASSKNDIIVVVDALRLTTTIITAIGEGVKSVKPVTSIEECVGEITFGERGGVKIPHLDYDNSPLTFLDKKLAGKEIVITATNGTEAIKASSMHNTQILLGSMINAKAVAKRALDLAHSSKRNISIVMAGRNNLVAREDLLSASEIVANLSGSVLKGNVNPIHSSDYVKDFLESDSGENLVLLGKKDDVLFCAQKNIYDIAPEYIDGIFTASKS
jgi:2-phosphosulfolactate phosphatase